MFFIYYRDNWVARIIYAGVVATTDLEEAVKGVEVAVMVGGFPRKAGMERKDVMSKNVSIYQSQAAALEKGAAKGVKVPPSISLPHSNIPDGIHNDKAH